MVPRGGAFAVLALALCACCSSLRATTAAASLSGVPAAAMAVGLGPAAGVRRPAETGGGGGSSSSASKRYESHTPVLLSALHAPDSSHQRMMLVDLSALHHHQEPVMGFQPDDYYGSSSSSNSMASADYGDTWEDNSLGADDRLYRRHQPHEEMHNEIGDSDQLLMPFLPENTVGLHYTGFPFIEDALHLQRQSSREDAFSDYLRALVASRDRKRSVFLSQSWQPGGHPGPSVPRRQRQTPQQQQQPRRVSQEPASASPELTGLTDRKSSERERAVHHRHHPAVPFIFSSKGWHPGGRKRNFFFSRGWGPGGRPLTLRADYFKKKPPAAHGGGGEDVSDNEASSLGLAQGVMGGGHGNSDSSPTVKATGTRHGHGPCRANCWRIPHLFGPYW